MELRADLVNLTSPPQAKIALFRSLFRGREDVYPRRFESRKTGKAGYRRDRRKDQLLQENGYLVLRFLAEDVGKELNLGARRDPASAKPPSRVGSHRPPTDHRERSDVMTAPRRSGRTSRFTLVAGARRAPVEPVGDINPLRHKYGTMVTCERPLKFPTACTVC
jgi:hypothetical protein